jgi:hypothetical protein
MVMAMMTMMMGQGGKGRNLGRACGKLDKLSVKVEDTNSKIQDTSKSLPV